MFRIYYFEVEDGFEESELLKDQEVKKASEK